MFKLIIMFILIFIWCMSLIHMVNQMPNSGNLHELSPYYILRNSERIVYMLLLFGSPGTTQHLPTVILEIFILTIGFTLQLVVVAQILQIVTKHSLSGNKYYQLTQQLEEFMRYKNLPDNIRARIMSYFDFRFQQSYYKEDEILKILSPQLRQEMLVHTYMNLLEKVNIFDDIPMAIICKIIYNMKQEIYLPSDVIVSAGTVGDSMYFIASGTVAVYTSTGKEICHLSDGANFGEIAIIMENEQRVASVVAIDCCEVFILHRKDFLKQIEKYPEIYARMRKMAQDRVRKTLVATFGVDDSDSEGDNISRKYSGRYLI
ncbi:PREDICTED: potassium/sodium hyperpolarization-activated cyclic nucleotide-gated channel 3-like isoform X2 [Nicrophorus vespilloides]|uniref:Potassium/sodium hyperpolarization-activated cyclic nucleotide-gated channel 3-like isoform X2 n=1 Tax=Nicrophorus vespilloides TaxID=110193 RepID=A0ABM1MZD8_NICVS|nr:PREDICTED: potassium/sodium hyperpolarization-activated cyclic nucleotide-gated channel 3-like isoform X2 [Nicrophorus vespilloides]